MADTDRSGSERPPRDPNDDRRETSGEAAKERRPPDEGDVERERPPPERDVERERPPAERERPGREREVERESPTPKEREVIRERPASGTAPEGDRPPPATREEPPAADRRDAIIWRVVQAVDYLFFLLYTLFLIRFVLAMMGASEEAGFVRFIQRLTDPFYAPFEAIAARPALDGGYLDLPLVVALIAYVFLHLAIRGLIRVIVGPRPPA